jgi:S-methylmethionine-dependent homocysteine/selenocysteine methylase
MRDRPVRQRQPNQLRFLGVGPKWVIQRRRIHDALAEIEHGRAMDWSALALRLGFADQAHFVHAFTELVGRPPASYEGASVASRRRTMAGYRAGLPQVGGGVFLTDSGVETVLIFHHGYELPDFAAFVLLDDEAGVETLRSYYRDHAAIARDAGAGFIFESPTWRASPDWAKRLGYTDGALAAANRKAIDMLVEIRSELDGDGPPMVVSGCVGPRGDGYQPSALMTADEAQSYHSTQIATFAETEADMVTGITITYPDEALGIVRAAQDTGMPAAISFTVETDGVLPDGNSLEHAISVVDDARGAVLPITWSTARTPRTSTTSWSRGVSGASASEGSGPTRLA